MGGVAERGMKKPGIWVKLHCSAKMDALHIPSNLKRMSSLICRIWGSLQPLINSSFKNNINRRQRRKKTKGQCWRRYRDHCTLIHRKMFGWFYFFFKRREKKRKLSFASEKLDLRRYLNRKFCFPGLPFSSLRREAKGDEAVSSRDNVGTWSASWAPNLEAFSLSLPAKNFGPEARGWVTKKYSKN